MNLGYHEKFAVGDKLILELTSHEVYEGEYSDGARNRIDLTNVLQHHNKNKLEGIYSFYRNEILKVHTLKPKPTKNKDLPDDKKQVNDQCGVVKIVEEEYNRLKEMSKNYIYIDNADSRYFEATKRLLDAETIGVVGLGMEKERSGCIIRLLVISTWKQVYIFDLINHRNRYFYPEIKEILESEYICKVIHKSAGIVDILYRLYNVFVQNTFDTQLVDLMIEKNNAGKVPAEERDISQCLTQYLNFPSSLLKCAVEVPQKKWMERPLSEKKKVYASQLATYLVLLKEHMQKTLLKDMYDMMNNVQDLVWSKSDYDFKKFMCCNEVDKDIATLIPNFKIIDLNTKLENVSVKQNGNANGSNESNSTF